jgi:diaminopimelate epimerase
MRAAFTKMHGLGNDFVVLDTRTQPLPPVTAALARALADRRTGIGCDQLIVIDESETADFRMRIFNPDGSEVEACGNATRAVAMLHGLPAQIETPGGILAVQPGEGGAAVDMGEPRFEWDAIPLAYAMDTLALPVGWDELEQPAAVNIGNPHAVFFVDDCDAVELDRLGPQIERDPLFPERVNVNVATVENDTNIRLRVWERGTGLTRACGTGACATAVAAMRRGLVQNELLIEWGEDGRITMTGPATESFRGTFDWGEFA